MNNSEPINKPWCLYGGAVGWRGIGKIVSETKNCVWVKYTQNSDVCAWGHDYVKRFSTLAEAAEEFARYKGKKFSRVLERMLDDFPEEAKQEQRLV